jgi:predicted DNA-binding transcriptional regulator YafY
MIRTSNAKYFGSIDFEATVDGLGEIAWWILGYGDKVRVLEPVALAQQVCDVAQRVVRQYAVGAA